MATEDVLGIPGCVPTEYTWELKCEMCNTVLYCVDVELWCNFDVTSSDLLLLLFVVGLFCCH